MRGVAWRAGIALTATARGGPSQRGTKGASYWHVLGLRRLKGAAGQAGRACSSWRKGLGASIAAARSEGNGTASRAAEGGGAAVAVPAAVVAVAGAGAEGPHHSVAADADRRRR